MLAKPKSKGVLLVADVVATLAVLAAPRTDFGSAGGVLAQSIFLYALVAAGRSVESINATVLGKARVPSSSGRSRCWLRARNLPRSIRPRNSWSILTSGILSRLRSRANDLKERCSPRSPTIKLNDRAGVTNGNKLTRNN